MILNILKYFQGFLVIQLSGRELERFINLCSRKDILLWNISSISTNCMECHISIQGFREIKPFVKKTKTKIIILRKYGLPFFMHQYRKRKIFFVCFVLAVLLLKLTSCYVWRVQVEGNSSISKDEIILFLENQSCAYGTRIAEIDVEALEAEVRENFSDIIWTSIDITGTCITVCVKENLILDNQKSTDDFKEDTGYDLIADEDGIIYSIVTRAGSPMVKTGDNVKKGDILVKGQISIEDDSEMVTQYIPCISDADIIIQREEVYQEHFAMKQERKNYEERVHTFYYLESRNSSEALIYQIMRKQNRTDCFLDKKQLCLWNNYYLPIYFCKLDTKKYTIEEYEYAKSDAKEKGKQIFEQHLRKMQEKGVQIVAKNVMITFEDGDCFIRGDIVTHHKVNTYQITSIEKIVTDEGQNKHES